MRVKHRPAPRGKSGTGPRQGLIAMLHFTAHLMYTTVHCTVLRYTHSRVTVFFKIKVLHAAVRSPPTPSDWPSRPPRFQHTPTSFVAAMKGG